MRRAFVRMAAMLAMATGAPAAALAAGGADQCAPVPGAEALWARSDIRWIVVGEEHGSAEMPAAFADLVCQATVHAHRPIVIGLELPPNEQDRLDAYMASDGAAAARAALLAGPFWHPQLLDGRSSKAWLALIERMRDYKAQGRIERVVAIRRSIPSEQGKPYDAAADEAAMADAMREAAAGDALALIYAGNIHALIRPPNGLAYAPAAALLPREAVVSINLWANGGSSWNCLRASQDEPTVCGPHDSEPSAKPAPRGIRFLDDQKLPWDAIFVLGGPVIASPPAVEGGATGASARE